MQEDYNRTAARENEAVEGISSEQKVVSESSRVLEDGSRVKMINETE